MKKLTLVLSVLLFVFKGLTAPFQNLDFEQANTNNLQLFLSLPSGPRYIGTAKDLLPGWQVYDNTNLITTLGYNFVLNDYGPAIHGPTPGTSPVFYYLDFFLSDHNYSIVQRGDIPLNAIRLTFSGVGAALDASINGIALDPAPIPGVLVSSYDVSPFAGMQNVELKITSPSDPANIQFFGYSTIDNLTFIIAEPVFVENDFNGDGLADVVFDHHDGFAGVWFMNKGPDLISSSLFNPEAVADPRWHIVGTGNFTHTNKTDLLFQHEDGSLAVWSMEGTNLVSAALLNPSQPGEGWKVVGTGDMNHDGQKDILFQHTDGTLVVWLMSGITLVQNPFLNPKKPADSGWRVVGTAALSSAGNTDLIFQHSDGTLAAWHMDGTNLVRGVVLNPATPGDAGWRVATTLDLNGDGKTDLLFQHADGTVAVWLMDGISLMSGQLLNPANPGSGWRIAGPR
jgi:FG-GAP repeat